MTTTPVLRACRLTRRMKSCAFMAEHNGAKMPYWQARPRRGGLVSGPGLHLLGNSPVAVLEFLARTAGAGGVARDLAPACGISRIELLALAPRTQRLSGSAFAKFVLTRCGIDVVGLHFRQRPLLDRRRRLGAYHPNA